MSMMFFADEAEVPLPPREVRITEVRGAPAPDRHRVALLITLTPFLEYPNLEDRAFIVLTAKKNAASPSSARWSAAWR